jgi:hypothetical protein
MKNGENRHKIYWRIAYFVFLLLMVVQYVMRFHDK